MQLWELFLISIGLAMDAFAVSICKGLSVDKVRPSHQLSAGLYFGGFQMLMPLIGFFLGTQFQSFIEQFDHWVAFILLCLIGINMIKESAEECETLDASFGFKAMLPLAIATSIDAMAVGVTFAFMEVNVALAVGLIGVITFILSVIGINIGNIFGCKYRTKAEIFGGIVLIGIGLKILLEGLNIF